MADIIVIGGGLIGMMTARELQQAGAEVLLLERGQLGGESTWAGGGILSPLYPWRYADAVSALAKYSQQIYQQFAEELRAETGIDPEYINSGLLILDQEESDQALVWAKHWRVQLQKLQSIPEVQQCEPSLSNQFDAALWMPEICQMRNPRLVKSLRTSLDLKKINYIEHAEVRQLLIRKQRIEGVKTSDLEYRADKVIVAGGAWSARIIGDGIQPPQIEPVKGQMIIFKAKPGVLGRIVLSNGRYLIPRKDGRILAGSTLEFTQFNKQTSAEARDELMTAALSMVPALSDYSIEHHWAGLRPGSPEGIPYICEHPNVNGLYINSGHYRNGVILGAASCRLMADIVLQRSPVIDPSHYAFSAKR